MRIAAPLAACLLSGLQGAGAQTEPDLKTAFLNPPAEFKAMPFWHMNGTLTPEEAAAQLRASRDKSGFGGVAVLPVSEMHPPFLSEEYFAQYAAILGTARNLGMQVILYDDLNFPSGSAGGRFAERYPDDQMHRLDKAETEVDGPAIYRSPLPSDRLMAAVAMNTRTMERKNLAGFVRGGGIQWPVPVGHWKVMLFTCAPRASNLVDYLNPASVDHFIDLTYGEYARRFPTYIGSTIRMTYFDDISFFGNRYWTPAFNDKFKARNGYDPALLYPALWYDIGPNTEAARTALFGFRAQLMSDGFPRRVGEWTRAHGIKATGHPAGNYEVQPVDMSGDIIKFYKYSDVPLMDAIFYHGHGRSGYKLVSSASENYDKPVTAVEIYGAFSEESTDVPMLYRALMEIFARGINFVVPHGMWYDPKHVRISPLISHFSEKIGPALPDYNRYVGRCCMLLQGGRHVSDIAVLYPIASLEGWFRFDSPDNKQFGTYVAPETDYLSISDTLTNDVRRDFTFLHPDTLDNQCSLNGVSLHLNHPTNAEDYKAIVIPGGKVIPWSSLKKIKAFYDGGGKVIATTCLPNKSAEFGHDADVQRTVRAMFGAIPAVAVASTSTSSHIRIDVRGTTITTSIDGVPVDTTVDTTFAHGGAGFREAPEESAAFANVRVTSASGPTLFQDDFRAGLGKWVNTDHANIRDGKLDLTNNQVMRARNSEHWADYTFEADVLSPDQPAGILFRSADDLNGYMWQFRLADKQLVAHKRVNGAWQILKSVPIQTTDFRSLPYTRQRNRQGGVAYFAPRPTAGTLQTIMNDALPIPDVRFENSPHVSSGNGMLSYLHKVRTGREIYFFANSSNDTVDTYVRLRGNITPEIGDPNTGAMNPAPEVSYLTENGQPITRLRLRMGPVKSLFVLGKETIADRNGGKSRGK